MISICFRSWYRDATPVLCDLYGKYDDPLVGDKSPDFYRSPELVAYLASSFPLIYTVRDPRVILSSIESQDDATPEEKAETLDLPDRELSRVEAFPRRPERTGRSL